MSAFSKVNIGVENRPSKPFNYSHAVNTTANFGSVQTLQCQYVPLGGSKVKFKNDSLVRCSPIVAPSFGQITQHIMHSFVPAVDIYPYFNEVLGQKPVAFYPGESNIIKKFPFTNTHMLTLFLLQYTRYAVFKSNIDTHGNELDYVLQSSEYHSSTYAETYFADLFNGGSGYSVPSSFVSGFTSSLPSVYNATLEAQGEHAYLDAFTPKSADFVLKPDGAFPGTQIDPYIVCFYLTDQGKTLYKHMISCGYKFTMCSYDAIQVSILPLLACAKAYFDNFRIAVYDNYTTTPMYSLYQHYMRSNPGGCFVSGNGSFDSTEFSLFLQILDYLADTQFSEDPDYISSQVSQEGDLPATAESVYDNIVLYNDANNGTSVGERFNTAPNASGKAPSFIQGRYNFTQLDDEMLKKLYYWINQTSKTGYQLRDLLVQRGYSQYVDECRSTFIGHEVNDVIIEGVTSLAATDQAVLGEFAGRAVQKSEGQYFEFDCPEIGFIVSQMAIVAGKNVVGGLNPQLLGVDPFTIYNPQLDGLGFEATPKAILGKVNQIQYGTTAQREKEVFGLSPRFTGFKTAGNSAVANGDMLRFRFRDTYIPYFLDRLMSSMHISSSVKNELSGGYRCKFDGLNDLWNAGKAWRFPNKYQWMGNFDRIFALFDETFAFNQDVVEHLDNFIVHNYIDFTLFARMLPIADTFETQEDEGKEPTISVNQ